MLIKEMLDKMLSILLVAFKIFQGVLAKEAPSAGPVLPPLES